jgi:thiol-disulfide isomerase/thioredoxin
MLRLSKMLGAGSPVPKVTARSAEGVEWPIPEGPVLLVLFKISCPTCQLTLPFLNRLGSALPVVGVSQNNAADTERFRQAFSLQYPVYLDDSQGYPVSNAFQITNVPSLLLIEGGRVTWSEHGFSRAGLSEVAARFGVELFRPTDRVPEFKPG